MFCAGCFEITIKGSWLVPRKEGGWEGGKRLQYVSRTVSIKVGDYFDIKGCGAKNDAMMHRSSLRQWRCGPNS